MNTIEHFQELFIYNDWANRKIIESLAKNSSEKALDILAHLLVTEKEYFERLFDKDSTGFDFWQKLNLEDCEKLINEISEKYKRVLESRTEADLNSTANYKTSEGVAYTNTLRELLTHVLLHSSIHRGNIIVKLREEGYVPPKIDYVIHLREIQ
jgi:uncharacterized damage-inducible protein DinB